MSRVQILSKLDFIEESFLSRPGAPSAKALRKWRRDADVASGAGDADVASGADDAALAGAAGFVVLAGDGVFASGDERRAALEALLSTTEALAPEAVIFRTPSRLAPSQENRDRFRDLCSEATREALGGAARILWPRGLWERSLGQKLADELELLLCFDPLANDPLEEIPALLAAALERGVAYLRLDRIGTPRLRFDPYELETLAEIAGELDSGWISFAHAERVRDAIALKALKALGADVL